MKLNYSMNVLFFLLICCFMSCTEEDDFIPEPTPTSTFIKGTAKTSNGEPLANVIVKLDYTETVWLGPQYTRHKAEGRTDKNGNYQIFFELKDDELKQNDLSENVFRQFLLTFDVNNLPKDAYIMPTDVNSNNESQQLFFSYGNTFFNKGKSYEHHLYIPQKRWMEVTVVNNQPLGSKDKFAIRNWISYGGNHQPNNSYFEGKLTFIDYPIELTKEKVQTFRIPCAVNDSNRIALGCMEGGSGSYATISPIQKIYVTKSTPESLLLENNLLSQQFKFKLEASSNRRTVAPFETIVFQITDLDGKYQNGMVPSFCSYYDSIVWSANGYLDQMIVYRDLDIPHFIYTPEWRCSFFQNESLYTRLQGYKNGQIIYSDSVQTVISSRDFLRYNWNDPYMKFDNGQYVFSCPLYKRAAFHYYISAEENKPPYSKVALVHNDDEKEETAFTERAQKTLSGLMDYHLGEQKPFDPATVGSLFHDLTTGAKPIAYWQTASTQVLLIESKAEGNTWPSIYLHAEPR